MGGEGVTPEHVLMAAATMHDMGRLVESSSGKGGLKMPHVTRGSGTGRKGGIKSRALGGDVEPGEEYLVGEHGPEVIVPKKKGTVIAAADIDPTKRQSPFDIQKETASGGGAKVLEGEIVAQPPAKAGASSATSRRLGMPHAAEINQETGQTYAESAQRASLGPMWGRLEKLGMSYSDIMNIELKDAYKFIKDRTVK
jgi:hypothetical protein